jgi:hypothetical protein
VAQFNSAVLVAGQYAVTWNAVAMGLFEGNRQSPTIEMRRFSQILNSTDAYGQTPIAGFSQGAEAFFRAVLLEYKTGNVTALWPFGTLLNVPPVSVDDYTLAQSLVLTGQAGSINPMNPVSITATHAFIAEGYPVELLFNTELRTLPLRMRLWPYFTSTTLNFGTLV